MHNRRKKKTRCAVMMYRRIFICFAAFAVLCNGRVFAHTHDDEEAGSGTLVSLSTNMNQMGAVLRASADTEKWSALRNVAR